ncbi:diacylglycerol kinase [Shewanella sp. 202IG2-18]|uniref:diacylglycerol kinase n=1 Tax=Parashewanella hymeniacidonis TaxID=2807618 RepID=UPI001961AB23|nr:diacylglycerol kinase [Parashewanella hymeniacidonis]MBM7070630.1 diacylglycerol kinase [Parashewanella hymeniacidonis]
MEFNSNNKPTGLRRIWLALPNSVKGFKWLINNESAFKQEIIMVLVTIVILSFWNITLYEKFAIFCAALLVLFAEIINTAIEVTVDRISYEMNPLSGLAKDLGSAAVFISLLIFVLVWLTVIYQNLL